MAAVPATPKPLSPLVRKLAITVWNEIEPRVSAAINSPALGIWVQTQVAAAFTKFSAGLRTYLKGA